MKHALAALFLLAAGPICAQDSADPAPEAEPSTPFLDLWADRTERMMRELLEEMQPGMEALLAEMLPRLRDLADTLGGIANYEMPEMLPNGDIIIRRKPDAPPLPEGFQPDNPTVDL